MPNSISTGSEHLVIPPQVINALKNTFHFLVEDIRSARRFLSSLNMYDSIEALHFNVLNKNTPTISIEELMAPLFMGKNIGVISESGCPCIADPGSVVVAYAHRKNIPVVPLVGPSSILLGLMASGLNGQQFAFHGYLPIEAKQATQMIKECERVCDKKKQTQIFIETPYRNNQVLDRIISVLKSTMLLTVAIDINGINEQINTKPIQEWKAQKPILPKLPTLFLFGQSG